MAALNASRTGTFRWNIVTNEIWWDEALRHLFGLPSGAPITSIDDFLRRVHPDHREARPLMAPLDALLALQDVDTAIDQQRHRRAHLPERAELAAIDGDAARLQASVAEASAARDEIAGRQAHLEAELAGTEQRAASVNRRLYGGEVRASRDLQALSADVDALKARASAQPRST